MKFFPKEDNNETTFVKIWNELHASKSNPKVGMLTKDAKTGVVAEEFQKFVESKSYTSVDISHFFNECFVKKDSEEI